LTAGQLREVLSPHFDLEPAASAREAWELIEADGSQSVLGFGTVADGTWLLGRLRDPAVMDALAADHGPDWRGLAVGVLHVRWLDTRLAGGFGKKPTCRYVHQTAEVEAAVAAREGQLAVLVPPATMGHVEAIAGRHEKMPPKSTYFYPKLLSGLLFHSLKAN